MRRSLLRSHAATRAAFMLIIVFVTAQMAWWIYFQARYVGEVSAAADASLQREVAAAEALLAAGAYDAARALLQDHASLQLSQDGTSVLVDEEALERFSAEQRSVVRMLAFEGPFFVLVVMAGLLIIARNLRLERELKRRQSNFLDAVGHEYKTPISALRLAIDTLSLRPVSQAKLHEYLVGMETQVERLERTGQQVLATARLEAVHRPEPAEPQDLDALVRDVVERSRSVLENRGAQVELQSSSGGLAARANPEDVTTILDNLLDNAVKYSSSGSKRVKVRVTGHAGWARISVEDNGSGIPEAARALVFDRFYRVGSELTRTTPGLGLGLYLVKRAATNLGGHVRLEPNPDGGTIAIVELPLHTQEAPAPGGRLSRARAAT